jgi:hypothetical protein
VLILTCRFSKPLRLGPIAERTSTQENNAVPHLNHGWSMATLIRIKPDEALWIAANIAKLPELFA